MDNPIEDLQGAEAFSYMKAAQYNITIQREKVDVKEALPFVMYRHYIDADGNPQLVEMARGTCGEIVDLGPDALLPEPRKIENRVTLSVEFPAGNWGI